MYPSPQRIHFALLLCHFPVGFNFLLSFSALMPTGHKIAMMIAQLGPALVKTRQLLFAPGWLRIDERDIMIQRIRPRFSPILAKDIPGNTEAKSNRIH